LAEGERNHDDRCLSIEIQRSRELVLDASLKAVLVPDFLNADDDVSRKLDFWETAGVRVKDYRAQRITNAQRTVEQIFPFVATLQGLPT
jgi:hypothetical protein